MTDSNGDDTARSAILERDVGAGESICGVVVRSVAIVSGTGIADLPPLYDAIDPDALEAIFPCRQKNGEVRFGYNGYTISVRANGTVAVYEGFGND